MTQGKKINSVIIVGAGISGTSLGILLARHGLNVTIFERNSEASQNQEDERSANFTVTNRGLALLEKIGVRNDVLANSKELTHRIIHPENQFTLYQKYGSDSLDHPRSIQRSDLLYILQKATRDIPNLNIRYQCHVTHLDKKKPSVTFSDDNRKTPETVCGDFVVGADGTFSIIRQHMIRGALINISISYFDWVYKKLVFSPTEAKNLNLDLNGLHVWPRKNGILFGLPNLNGSVACIFCAQFDKSLDLQSSESTEYFHTLFRNLFPNMQSCPDLLKSFHNAKISGLVNVQMSSFHHQEKVVLVGDACHAVFPFYGQGMNAALEDCLALVSSLEQHKFYLTPQVFTEYNRIQKQSADALQHLSTQHFFELRDRTNSPLYEVKTWTSPILERLFPAVWKNEYSMIVRGGTSYDQAVRRISRQRIYKWLFMIKFLEFSLVPLIIFKRWLCKVKAKRI